MLWLYSSFLALQAQHAARGYYKVTISELRECQIDMPMEVEDYVPSPPPMELAQPPKAGTDYKPASKTSPPQDEPDQELDDAQSRVINNPEQEPRPGSDINVDYEPLLPEGRCADIILVPTISELKMRSDSRLACYVISNVLEPQTDDD